MKKIFAILAMALMAATAVAQEYRYEVGPALGVSGYIGDISSGNMYKHPGIVGGGAFRYNMNSRIAFKGNLLYASIHINGFLNSLTEIKFTFCFFGCMGS